jgi:hypothetical protein
MIISRSATWHLRTTPSQRAHWLKPSAHHPAVSAEGGGSCHHTGLELHVLACLMLVIRFCIRIRFVSAYQFRRMFIGDEPRGRSCPEAKLVPGGEVGARRRSLCPKAKLVPEGDHCAQRRSWCPKAIIVPEGEVGARRRLAARRQLALPEGDWHPEGSCWLTENGDIRLTADPAGADMTAAAGRQCPPRTHSNCAVQAGHQRPGRQQVYCTPWLHLVGRQLRALSPSADGCRAGRHPTACPKWLTPG